MNKFTDKRSLVYWSKIYLTSLLKGDEYEKAKKTICIWILDGEKYEFQKYHSKWQITEKEEGETEHFKDLEIHVIELKKFRELDIIDPRKKEFWLWFIDHTKKELVEMSYSLKEVLEAKEIYEKITADRELMLLIVQEQMAEMDRKNDEARMKRLEEAAKEAEEAVREAEEAVREAEEAAREAEEAAREAEEAAREAENAKKEAERKAKEAKETGRTEGMAEGEKNEKIKTAKRMLELGVEIDIIEKTTGLSKEQIEKIK